MNTDETEKRPPLGTAARPSQDGTSPLPEGDEDEMGKTMMDIDPSQFLNKDKRGGTPAGPAEPVQPVPADSSSSGGESVDQLLKKKRSLKDRIGKLFGK